METPFEVGTIVTWGSGRPRARVVEVEGDRARIQLVADVVGACGRRTPVGTYLWFDVAELRALEAN